jgi:hypothetical protein
MDPGSWIAQAHRSEVVVHRVERELAILGGLRGGHAAALLAQIGGQTNTRDSRATLVDHAAADRRHGSHDDGEQIAPRPGWMSTRSGSTSLCPPRLLALSDQVPGGMAS